MQLKAGKRSREQREQILTVGGIGQSIKGNVGNDDQVLESLNRLSLEAWNTKAAALPQRLLMPKQSGQTSGTQNTTYQSFQWYTADKGRC